jgi:hypothetical protein
MKTRSFGEVKLPIDYPEDPPPSIPGIEVKYVDAREWRHSVREAESRARLATTQAIMKARKKTC